METVLTTKRILIFNVSIMGVLILAALVAPGPFTALLTRPEFYLHAKFIHIVSVTLFFANTVIGTLWEVRSLYSGRAVIIEHTYQTVRWLDAVFTAPLIICGVVSGIMLGTILGGIWSMGWLSLAFLLFLLSGLVWLVADLPSQHQVKRLFELMPPGSERLTPELTRLLWRRMGINFLGFAPLLVIFFLMVHKPELPALSTWLKSKSFGSGKP